MKNISLALLIIINILLFIINYSFMFMLNKTASTSVKPIIYLYPTEEICVNVKVCYPNKLTHTFPKYNQSTGWNVMAKPNGDLIDLNTKRNLYALYWEGINNFKIDMTKGFVVEGKDTISFLEKHLALLGLNEREANEFIIYWLPKLENNNYNWIYFVDIEEINRDMPLIVTPKPDTMIRVFMQFKAIGKPIKTQEQVITTPIRNGFTLVEWGGTEL